jgi:hypothetical protein
MRQNDDRCWANTFAGGHRPERVAGGCYTRSASLVWKKRCRSAKMTQLRRLDQSGVEAAAISFAERVHLVSDLCNFKPLRELLVLSIGSA